jgi:hypothetical protein
MHSFFTPRGGGTQVRGRALSLAAAVALVALLAVPAAVFANNPEPTFTKTADVNGTAGTSATSGDTIGFTVSFAVTDRSYPATNVTMTDTLPSNAGLSWVFDNGTTTSSPCTISGSPQVLTCNWGNLNYTSGNSTTPSSASIHVKSTTTTVGASPVCGAVTNSAYSVTFGWEDGSLHSIPETASNSGDGYPTTVPPVTINVKCPPPTPTINLTVEKVICPSYSLVPANNNYTNLAEYPSGATLNTSPSRNLALTNPATDVPAGCVPEKNWNFEVGTGSGGGDVINSYQTVTTGPDGTYTFPLNSAQVTATHATSWASGLLVSEVTQPGATFGELRCYRDIQNGDNLESIYNLQSSDIANGVANIYCIAYNVEPPGTIIVKKVVTNTYGGSTDPSQFSLYVKDATGTNVNGSPANGSSAGVSYTLPPGTYSVGEVTPIPSGYQLAGIDCQAPSQEQPAGITALSIETLTNPTSVNLTSGETVTCTVTNDGIQPQLMVIKHVDNSAGGSAVASDFTMRVNGTNVQPSASFPGSESGTTVSLNVGSYSVTESHLANYVETTSGDCSGTIALGDQKTCTITNTYTPPPPPNQGFFYFTKTVNGNLSGWGGGAFNFTVTCNGTATPVSLTFPASGGTQNSQMFGPFTPGVTCSVAEGTPPSAGTGASWNGPVFAPASSAVIVKNVNTNIGVTDTRGVTPLIVTPTPTPTPTATPTPTPTPTASVAGATGTPKPSGGVKGATGTPSLPPTSSLPGSDGGAPNGSLLLLLGALGALSVVLVVSTGLRGRLLERADR